MLGHVSTSWVFQRDPAQRLSLLNGSSVIVSGRDVELAAVVVMITSAAVATDSGHL